MNNQVSEDASRALEKLTRLIEENKIVEFTPEEAKALKEVAVLWGQIKAVAALGGTMGSFLKWVVFFAASYAALKAGFLDWIRAGIER